MAMSKWLKAYVELEPDKFVSIDAIKSVEDRSKAIKGLSQRRHDLQTELSVVQNSLHFLKNTGIYTE